MYINASRGQYVDPWVAMVDQKVESVPNSTQLFQDNSLASKAVRAYSRMAD